MTPDDTDRSIVLEDGRVNVFDAGTIRLAKGSVELMMRELCFCHDIREQLPVMNQDLWPSFDDGLQLLSSIS